MSAKGKGRRRLSADEKLKILEEARQPNTTVAEVLRRHQLDATTFYRWEREVKAAMFGIYKAHPDHRVATVEVQRGCGAGACDLPRPQYAGCGATYPQPELAPI